MASRRGYYEDRGSSRYSAPRRDDRRDDRRHERRDDRRDDRRDRDRSRERKREGDHDRDYYRNERDREDTRRRRGEDRYSGRERERDREQHRDRFDDRHRRDDRRRGDHRRDERHRSRSPRDQSRDPRGNRYRDHDRYDPRDQRRNSDARPRSSHSTASGADPRPSSRSSNLSREELKKREEEKKKQEEEDKKAKRLAKVQKWKKEREEKAAAAAAAAGKTVDKKPFQLDASAAARPAGFKAAAKPNGTVESGDINGSQSAAIGNNIGAFGLKTKSATGTSDPNAKVLLDDGEKAGKRSLQPLAELAPVEGQEFDATVADTNGEDLVSDMGSPEGNVAELQAQLEKRRAEIAQEGTKTEGTPGVVGASGETMDVDDAAGAQDEDVDPLDAFMNNLATVQPKSKAPPGETMFGDDLEPDLTAVENEDLLALTMKKKKQKEIPTVNHDKVEYQPFRKNFYTVPVAIDEMTEEEVADLRHDLDGIKVRPANAPRPVVKWAQMGLLTPTMDLLHRLHFEKPTPIQAQAIPIVESGLDMIGIAKTGSGKTLAFGIPIIRHILDQPKLKPSDGPIGLVLAPTRELTGQIVNELKPFLKASHLNIAGAFGGKTISDDIGMIKKGGIHVLCATPGRLIDLLQSNSGRVLNFTRVTYVVLDEADRMFDMGFEPQVMKILANVRPDRQTIFFSATFPKNMQALARKAASHPVEVTVGGRSVVAPEVEQIVKILPPSYDRKVTELIRQLGNLFGADENAQVLIFVERQENAEDLLSKLHKAKYYAVDTIHGAKDQSDRTEAIDKFKRGVLPILIATSVAARGLDVPGLAMVINFDCPTHLEDYVHRVGRTGRAGNKGTAITFLENPGQERNSLFIRKALKQSGHEVPDDIRMIAEAFDKKIQSGEEKWFDPGFGGKGLEKLDAARASEKRREKRAHKIEGEDDSEEEVDLPELKKPKTASDATADVASELPSYMQILSNKIVVNKTERAVDTGPKKPMTAMERAMAAANKVDGRLSRKGMIHHGQPIDNKGPDAGAFHSTIEINDFPQRARWAVTNRTNVVKILESTGVSITTKGNFYAPGKSPGENDLPKLYILVEGDTENVVTAAMMEITRLLREATINAEETSAPRGATGRYSVI
ncbi:DEAD-domain-containing protein [Periconia macrospinosa]|uniref:RNA helicase n=1 Tax=Periconia macrospinosa TaxID=97972 RepID=A0A2V1ED60_9PLEO|nr:DEAD-domain-containing protein [Periconia macrospinosa]